jgi:hypothetical protein
LDSVPESFQGFAPEKPDPIFKYGGDPEPEANNVAFQFSAKIVAVIKQKCTQEQLQDVLKELQDDEPDQVNPLRVKNIFLNA